jgi:hypothetical protein
MQRSILKRWGLVFLTGFFIILTSLNFLGTFDEIVPRVKRSSGRGIYVTANVARAPDYFRYLRWQARKSGINTIVIDAKRDLEVPVLELVKDRKLKPSSRVYANPWLTRLTKQLHDQGFIVTARLVVFKDDHLVLARPDLAITMPGGGLYYDHKWGRWVDPYSEEVRLYNQLIAEIAALSGVDEVQFDYIRFPAEGKAAEAVFPFQKEGESRVDVICKFLKEARERLDKYNLSIGVDIFGVTAWQKHNDIENLGQDLRRMADHIDVLSPMLYPSHFHSGYDGIKEPGAHPYYFVNAGVRKAKRILKGKKIKIVPWIQGFDLRSPDFGPSYVLRQVLACQDEGINSFLVWNAR